MSINRLPGVAAPMLNALAGLNDQAMTIHTETTALEDVARAREMARSGRAREILRKADVSCAEVARGCGRRSVECVWMWVKGKTRPTGDRRSGSFAALSVLSGSRHDRRPISGSDQDARGRRAIGPSHRHAVQAGPDRTVPSGGSDRLPMARQRSHRGSSDSYMARPRNATPP